MGDASSARRLTFERVYAEGRWIHGADNATCRSGYSGPAQAKAALQALITVVASVHARSVLDVPCGDGCFAGAMLGAFENRTGGGPPVAYTGLDIVGSLVERNQRLLGGPYARFVQADVASAAGLPLPTPWADLVFSRQMTQHMCDEDVKRFLGAVARSGARFALLTTFATALDFANGDIPCASGDYRPQDLTKPPFSLPPPLQWFPEHYPLDSRVGLGLWSVRSLRRLRSLR